MELKCDDDESTIGRFPRSNRTFMELKWLSQFLCDRIRGF